MVNWVEFAQRSTNNNTMLKSYLKIAVRSLLRQKSSTLINVFGLSTGIMACLIILLYVNDAASYEKMYPDADNIFRLTTEYNSKDGRYELNVLPAKAIKVAYESVPETNHLTLLNGAERRGEILVEVGGKKYKETNYYAADTAYFKVFEHDFIQGNAEEALSQPDNVVITASIAKKYFGRTDVYGEPIKISGTDRLVGGVINDFQGNTVLDFDILLSTLRQTWIQTDGWYPMNFQVFGRFNSPQHAGIFEEKLDALVHELRKEEMEAQSMTAGYNLEPIVDMYFNTSVEGDFSEKMPLNLMYSLIIVALFILVIACINYINLSTAKSEKRAKEVGVRKVMGAMRKQLIWQFYGEIFVITLISVVIGVVLTEVLLTPFNNLLGTQLEMSLLNDNNILFGLIGIIVLVSLLSGSYPASFLSSFQPVKVLKGNISIKGGNGFRRVLVTMQFVVTVFLIVGTITMTKQLRFIQDKEVGFDQDQIVYLKLSDRKSKKAYEGLKESFLTVPGIEAVTASNNLIANVVSGYGAVLEGEERVNASFKGHNGDKDFVETMGVELIAGDGFKNKSDMDSSYYYLINETASKAMGMTPEDAIGRRFGLGGGRIGVISGVVKDFHMNSIHTEIEPWAVFAGPDKYMHYLFVRVNMNRLDAIKAEMAAIWEDRIDTFPFELNFVDQTVKAAYDKDRQLNSLIVAFTVLAIIIGSLGLFGLAAHLAEKRTKEIGIRKVLGASVNTIVFLLSKEYMRILLISNLIAWPLSYYFMTNWLDTFAYRINVNWAVFLLAAIATGLVAGITVSYQSLKAAVSNPINALRNE